MPTRPLTRVNRRRNARCTPGYHVFSWPYYKKPIKRAQFQLEIKRRTRPVRIFPGFAAPPERHGRPRHQNGQSNDRQWHPVA